MLSVSKIFESVSIRTLKRPFSNLLIYLVSNPEDSESSSCVRFFESVIL